MQWLLEFLKHQPENIISTIYPLIAVAIWNRFRKHPKAKAETVAYVPKEDTNKWKYHAPVVCSTDEIQSRIRQLPWHNGLPEIAILLMASFAAGHFFQFIFNESITGSAPLSKDTAAWGCATGMAIVIAELWAWWFVQSARSVGAYPQISFRISTRLGFFIPTLFISFWYFHSL